MSAPYIGRALPTPGPWIASEPNGPGMGWRVGPAWLGTNPCSDQTAADARIIRAAHEMLAALQQINEWCCYSTEEDTAARLMALQQIGVHARAAIARAVMPPNVR